MTGWRRVKGLMMLNVKRAGGGVGEGVGVPVLGSTGGGVG